MRPLIFGEVLFDHFPDGSRVLGGAPFNVAWNLQALGLSPLFISRVGDDAAGAEIREAMRQWGMDLAGLQTDPSHATGRVQVTLEQGEPQFNIVHPSAWDYIDAGQLPELPASGLLYHGSLALRSEASATALAELQRLSNAPRFVDINLRQPWWQQAPVQQMLAGARWIKLNEDELQLVGGAADTLLTGETMLVALTRGGDGATLYTHAGHHSVRPRSDTKVVDAVGAGDAFASVLIAGVLQGWGQETTLLRAQELASAVVGMRGATSRDIGFYRRLADEWKD